MAWVFEGYELEKGANRPLGEPRDAAAARDCGRRRRGAPRGGRGVARDDRGVAGRGAHALSDRRARRGGLPPRPSAGRPPRARRPAGAERRSHSGDSQCPGRAARRRGRAGAHDGVVAQADGLAGGLRGTARPGRPRSRARQAGATGDRPADAHRRRAARLRGSGGDRLPLERSLSARSHTGRPVLDPRRSCPRSAPSARGRAGGPGRRRSCLWRSARGRPGARGVDSPPARGWHGGRGARPATRRLGVSSCLASQPNDKHLDPGDLDTAAEREREFRRYLDWEIALVHQLAGDPAAPFAR